MRHFLPGAGFKDLFVNTGFPKIFPFFKIARLEQFIGHEFARQYFRIVKGLFEQKNRGALIANIWVDLLRALCDKVRFMAPFSAIGRKPLHRPRITPDSLAAFVDK